MATGPSDLRLSDEELVDSSGGSLAWLSAGPWPEIAGQRRLDLVEHPHVRLPVGAGAFSNMEAASPNGKRIPRLRGMSSPSTAPNRSPALGSGATAVRFAGWSRPTGRAPASMGRREVRRIASRWRTGRSASADSDLSNSGGLEPPKARTGLTGGSCHRLNDQTAQASALLVGGHFGCKGRKRSWRARVIDVRVVPERRFREEGLRATRSTETGSFFPGDHAIRAPVANEYLEARVLRKRQRRSTSRCGSRGGCIPARCPGKTHPSVTVPRGPAALRL